MSKVYTRRFIEGTALMLLRGLKTLIILKDFRFGKSGINEIIPITTTMKSITFQGSLKYDFL